MMNRTTRTGAAVVLLVGIITVLSMQPSRPAHAADPRGTGIIGFAPIAERNGMAAGAADDSLKACMARIPDVASAGQRLLAEQSCAGDEQVRNAIRSAPKF